MTFAVPKGKKISSPHIVIKHSHGKCYWTEHERRRIKESETKEINKEKRDTVSIKRKPIPKWKFTLESKLQKYRKIIDKLGYL